jgi:hypothetical protein
VTKILRDDKGNEYKEVSTCTHRGACIAHVGYEPEEGDIVCRPVPKPAPSVGLLPCPFCTGEAVHVSVCEYGGMTQQVACLKCQCGTRDDCATKLEAAALWNARAEERARKGDG